MRWSCTEFDRKKVSCNNFIEMLGEICNTQNRINESFSSKRDFLAHVRIAVSELSELCNSLFNKFLEYFIVVILKSGFCYEEVKLWLVLFCTMC